MIFTSFTKKIRSKGSDHIIFFGLTCVESCVAWHLGRSRQRVQAKVGDLKNEAAINQTIGRAQFSMHAQLAAVDVAHALRQEVYTFSVSHGTLCELLINGGNFGTRF